MVEGGAGGTRVAGPHVVDHEIVFSVPDPGHALVGVRLVDELDLPGVHREFRFDAGVWSLGLPHPPVRRMEYQLALRHADGGTHTTTDPGNPTLTPGAFGDKSVLELAGYTAPSWLGVAAPWPVAAELTIDTANGPVEVIVRSPADTTARLLLRRQGYPASLREVPDPHNYVAWRDGFDPHLAELLTEVWGHA